ncbi:MAG: FtsX-like permease family protein [Gemmatimonadales bacterium]
MAGVAALAVAHWATGTLRSVILPDIRWGPSVTDHRTVIFVFGTALGAGLISSTIPAWLASRPDLLSLMNAAGTNSSARYQRARSILIAIQIGLCTVTLICCAALVRSANQAVTIDLGFDDLHVVSVDAVGIDDRIAQTLMPEARDRILRVPGVQRVAIVGGNILRPNMGTFVLRLSNGDTVPRDRARQTTWNIVDTGFFRTAGIRLLSGRQFSRDDGAASVPVAIVNEVMAKRYWPGVTPIGTCFYLFPDKPPCVTIVGIVADTRVTVASDPPIRFYLPMDQSPSRYYMPPGYSTFRGKSLVVRTNDIAKSRQVTAVELAARQVLGRSARLHVSRPRDQLASETGPFSASAWLLAALGLLGLVLGAVGVYGSVSYEVERQTRTFALRAALGAGRWDIFRNVLGFSTGVAATGSVLGLLLAFAVSRSMSAFLFHASTTDVTTMVGAVVLVVLTTIGAGMVPAIRAMKVDPVLALRSDV